VRSAKGKINVKDDPPNKFEGLNNPARRTGLNTKRTPPTGGGANHDPPNKFGGLNSIEIASA